MGWWTASQLLTANCATKRLFLTPVGGAKPTPLTPAITSPYKVVDAALRLAGHVYVQLSGPACDTGTLGVVRSGRLASVPVPGVTHAAIVTASTSRLLVVAQSCMGSSGLLLFNPATSAEVHVLRKNQGQGVIGWVPYYKLGS